MAMLVVDVDKQLLERFRRFAVNKHGKIYGVLKPEIEMALENHLRSKNERVSSAEGDNR
jgi:hypothetical protein